MGCDWPRNVGHDADKRLVYIHEGSSQQLGTVDGGYRGVTNWAADGSIGFSHRAD